MKKQILLFLLVFMPLFANAYDVEIDGIYYYLNQETKEAEVTNGGIEGRYSGSIVIPSSIEYEGVAYSVTTIASKAFKGCSSLNSISIPSSITSIGGSVFSDCTSLYTLKISDLSAWCKIHFANYSSHPFYFTSGWWPQKQIYINGERVNDLVIPNDVKSISSCAFYHCSNLTSVEIPNSVTSIGDRAFENCI